jgi:uncharacterized RDD family membrane protein YckC
MIWYYAENNAQAGPVSDEQLRELAQAGRIQGATLVWKAGMDAWTPLAQAVPGMAASLPAAAVAKPSVSSDTAATQRPFGQLMPETALCESCKQFKPLDELVQISGQRICADCKPLALQKLQQGQLAIGIAYGGFWRRFGASILDSLILLPVVLITYFFVVPKMLGSQPLNTLVYIALLALTTGYRTYFHGRYFATPGKMIAGLKVVRSDGSAINYKVAAIRAVVESGTSGIPLIGPFIALASCLMVAFDVPQRRAIHDHAADTRVVKA